MKKTNKAIITTAAVAVAATTIAPLGNVFAATAPTWDGSSSATLIRKIPNAYGTISNTFGYTITADSNNPAGATGAPTAASVVYNDSYTTQGEVSKAATLDFSGMQFERVGDYSYAITESSSTKSGVYPVDTTSSYTAVVSVRNNATLTGYVASLYIKDSDGNKLSTISGASSDFIFTKAPVYTNIQVTATASGNAADPDKCFDYTVTFNTTDSYKVTTASECENSGTVANGGTIKLKHGDTVTIGLDGTNSEIPVGTNYSIAKADTSDGYTTSMDGVEQTSTGTKTMVATGAPTFNTANVTAIDENRESAVDTNAVVNTTIYILLTMAGAAGLYCVATKKNKKEA